VTETPFCVTSQGVRTGFSPSEYQRQFPGAPEDKTRYGIERLENGTGSSYRGAGRGLDITDSFTVRIGPRVSLC